MSKIIHYLSSIQSGAWGSDQQNNSDDVKCIRVADFQYENLRFNDPQTIRNVLDKEKYRVLGGDILIEKSGGGEKTPVGRAVYSSNDSEYIYANFIDRLRPKQKKFGKYLTYFLAYQYSTGINTKYIKQNTGIQNLDIHEYLREEIELPIQSKWIVIADFLDQKVAKIDEAIAKKKKLIELLEEKRTSSVVQSLHAELANKEYIRKPVKFIARINLHSLPETTDAELRIRYIDISSVDSKGFNGDYQDFYFSEAPSRARRVLSRGSTIIATVRTYLKAVAYFENPEDDIIVSTGFAVLDPLREIYPKFLYYSLTADEFVQRVEANSVGVSYPAINPSDLGSLKIDLPLSINAQKEIVDKLDILVSSIEKAKSKILDTIGLLEEYKISLISNAVTGRVKV